MDRQNTNVSRRKLALKSALCAVILLVAIAVNAVALYWGQALVIFFGTLGGNSNSNKNTYTIEYENEQDLLSAQESLVRRLVDEGTVLLVNDGSLPLSGSETVTLLGQSSVNWLTTGTGSSAIQKSDYPDLTLRSSLEKAGFKVNPAVWDYYSNTGKRLSSGGGGLNAKWNLNETDWDTLFAACGSSFGEYSDAAVLVVSRIGCEGGDLPRDMSQYEGAENENYLELSQTERELLRGAKKSGFKKIIVILNTCNALQMDFLKDSSLGVNACLSVGATGANGLEELGRILSGEVNPSGHLVDTLVYDNMTIPVMQNFGDQRYIDTDDKLLGDDYAVINYGESIYVGYRYFETRYEDKISGSGNAGNYDYAADVAFPFGYGLSYTDFTYSSFSLSDNGKGKLTVKATVTNTGNTAGKDAVGLYYQSPYTDYDRANRVEKSAVCLADFVKTKELKPGESEVVRFTFDADDTMKSYDAYGAGTYIMDAGSYYLTIAPDVHGAVNNVLAAKGYTAADGMTANGDASMTGVYNVAELVELSSDAATGNPVKNEFDDAVAEDAVYLSRSDWSVLENNGLSYCTETMTIENGKLTVGVHTADEELTAHLKDISWAASGIPADKEDNSEAVKDTPAGIELVDMVGLDYDDPKWEPFISQMKVSELHSLYNLAGYMTQAVESVNKPATVDLDGGLGLTNYINNWHSFAYPAENVTASTWNKELAAEFGSLIGDEALSTGVNGWYAPAMNIHRAPFSGRNYDYYSEDPILSGKMGAAVVSNANRKGLYTFVKHFAVNDQETKRSSLATWVQEQAMREIYLKPFELAVKEGGTTAIMASMNRIGYRYTRGSYALLTAVLREEWGFRGAVITDACLTKGTYSDMALAAGIDLQLNTTPNKLSDTKSNIVRHALQKAAKNTCYMVANSHAMKGISKGDTAASGIPIYLIILGVLDLVLLAGAAAIELRAIHVYRHGEKEISPEARKRKMIVITVILILAAVALIAGGSWLYSYIAGKQI